MSSTGNDRQVSICIVTHNACQEIRAALASIEKYAGGLEPEVIVVDNGSAEDVAAIVAAEFPSVILVRSIANLGYARAMNAALQRAHGQFALTLSHDAEVRPGAVQALLDFMRKHPQAGLAGPRTVDPDGRIVNTLHFPGLFLSLWAEIVPVKQWLRRGRLARRLGGAIFRNRSGLTTDYSVTRQAVILDGGCIMARRECLDNVGLLDPNIPQGPDDYDWCYRARSAGFEVWYVAESEIIHRQRLGEDVTVYSPSHLRMRLPQLCYLYGKYHGRLRSALFDASAYLLVQKWRLLAPRLWPDRPEFGTSLRDSGRLCLDREAYFREVERLWGSVGISLPTA